MVDESIFVHVNKKDSGVYVIYINGNIVCNLSGTVVREEVENILEKETKPKIILNIRDVRYLDSYSFGWLTKSSKKAISMGGCFALTNANIDISNLISMMHFDQAVKIYETEEIALENFNC